MSWAETLFLKKYIDGKKAFVASDTVLKNADTITPKLDGVLSAIITINPSSSSVITVTVRIYENDSLQKSTNLKFYSGGDTKQSIPFNVIAGNAYRVEATDSHVRDISIGGQVTDYRYYE